MSFSGNVKDELAGHVNMARHCQIAELAAIFQFCARIEQGDNGESALVISAENEVIVKKCFTLLRKTFNIETSAYKNDEKSGMMSGQTAIRITDSELVWNIFRTLKLVGDNDTFYGFGEPVNPILIKNSCCRRAYLRGTFLCVGSMSDPVKGYHLELVTDNERKAFQIQQIIREFELDAKIIRRKKYFVVYLKEGSNIVDFLNICEAHVSLMQFENERIVKEMRNSINRRVNCETANISKTVNAAAKQISDIGKIRDTIGFSNLPQNLREMAMVRLEYPDASLKELGGYLVPPVGKSGVNHRLRKLSEIADEIM
ncbi:MAG: DNA-binding protein WhiA [Lachnospiraceae bacterium]|nr:DNA-binding protein WhiA [Lachnospiraceae bacterium]